MGPVFQLETIRNEIKKRPQGAISNICRSQQNEQRRKYKEISRNKLK
jgi:hypothetical protein